MLMVGEVLFSIVIPTHNYGCYLPCAISSVIQQARTDVEIIVVDDASTDNTPAVVAEFRDQLRYLRHERKQGPAAAWATGLRLARGQFVCKLDADDWQLPGFLNAVESAFNNNPNAGAVFSSVYLCTEGEPLAEEYRMTFSETQMLTADAFRRRLLSEFFMRMPGAVLRRKCVEGQPLPIEELFIGHDWEYFLRVLRGYDVVLLGEPKAVYRIHRGSVTDSAIRLERIEKDFAYWLRMSRREATPYCINDSERRVLAFGMATTLMRIVGFPAWERLRNASFFSFVASAFRLAVSENAWLGFLVAGYLTHRAGIKLFHALMRGRAPSVVSVSSTSLYPVRPT